MGISVQSIHMRLEGKIDRFKTSPKMFVGITDVKSK